MRRSLAALVAVTVAVPTVLLGPPTLADVRPHSVHVQVKEDGSGHRIVIRTDVLSSADITRVTAKLNTPGTFEPYAWIDDFKLVSGSARSGAWEATAPFDVAAHPGRNEVTISATDTNAVGSSVVTRFQGCYLTTVLERAAQPSVIDASAPRTTLSGRLMFRRSAEAQPEPVVGETLQVTGDGQTVTDAEGRFRVEAEGFARPSVSNEDTSSVYCSASYPIPVQVRQLDTELSGKITSPAGSGAVPAGSPLVIDGRLLWKKADGTGGASKSSIQAFVRTTDGRVQPLSGVGTAADGTFSVRDTALNSGEVFVKYEETAFLKGAEVHVGEVKVYYDTRFTGLQITQPTAGRVKAAGILSRKTVHTEWSVSGARVLLEWSPDGKTWSGKAEGVTASTGAFDVEADVPAEGFWRVRYEGKGDYRPATSGPVSIRVSAPTSLTTPAATPSPVTEGATLTVKSRLTRQGSGVLANAPVALEFSTGGTTWSAVAQGRTDAKGDATLKARATRSGLWRVRYAGDSTAKPSVSASVAVKVRWSTRFQKVNAGPEPVRKGRTLTVLGTLQRHDPSWRNAAAGAQVAVYFKAKGSSKWTRMAVVKTDRKGAFRKGFKASKDGYWKVAYPGSSSYAPSESGADYVDVR